MTLVAGDGTVGHVAVGIQTCESEIGYLARHCARQYAGHLDGSHGNIVVAGNNEVVSRTATGESQHDSKEQKEKSYFI